MLLFRDNRWGLLALGGLCVVIFLLLRLSVTLTEGEGYTCGLKWEESRSALPASRRVGALPLRVLCPERGRERPD
jgi:hypothetical protein